MTLTLTTANFNDEVIASTQPVLVDFWAPWCGPCRMLAPVIEEIATEKQGSIKVGKINIDEQPELARQFRVMSIPTVVLFQDGKPVAKTVGAEPKHVILKMLEQ